MYKKDLNSGEMDTLTKSCSPTIVITANGEVQTHEEAIVYVKELDIFLTIQVLENTPAVLPLGKLCDEHGYSYEWINGQKPHLIKNGNRIQCNTENFVSIVVQGLSSSSSSRSHSSTSMTASRQERNHPTSSSSSSTSPTTVLSDSETRERRDSHASSSREPSLEPTPKRREDLGKHGVYTHFPKDRNCEICQRTKITRAPCRRRNSGAVPRAENFGDLVTADHTRSQ